MAMKFVNGRRFYYTQPGKSPGGPGLLLIHGAGGSHLDWPREIQRLPGLNVYNIDLPGHGRSEGAGYDEISEYARDLNDFAAALDLTDMCVAGHSMGGAIAQSLAHKRPRWLSSVVLIGTGAHLPVSPQILEGLQTNADDAVSLIMRYTWRRGSSPELVALTSRTMLATGAELLYKNFLACNRFDLREDLGDIEVPALVICGSDDRMTPVDFGRCLAAGIPGARLVVIEDAGHFVTLEQPHTVAEAIATFIRDHHFPGNSTTAIDQENQT